MTPEAVRELKSQNSETPWLVLMTVSHPSMPYPLRMTSDGVPTISRGETYVPYAFQITWPDDREGTVPIAQLMVDNTSQEIIAALRSISTAPKITFDIIRSSNPDIVERSVSGLELRNITYNVGTISGQLTAEDWATEEFPFSTFDGRWRGLW